MQSENKRTKMNKICLSFFFLIVRISTGFGQESLVPASGSQQGTGLYSCGIDVRSPGLPVHCDSPAGGCTILGQGVGGLE